MTPKTLSIGIIAAIVVAGGVYWLWPRTPGTSTALPSGGSTSGFYQSSDTTQAGTSAAQPSGGQSTVQTTPSADIEAAYSNLLQTLLAQKVSFRRVSSTSGADGSIYALYSKDIADAKSANPNAQDLSIGVATVDITDDGVPEALVYEDLPGYCGTAGCVFSIYTKAGTGWLKIFSKQVQDVALANVITSGHTDLLLSLIGTTGYQTNIARYVWAGTMYRFKGLVAVWTGSGFVIREQ